MRVKNLKMGVLSCILAAFLFSCEREIVQPAQPTPEEENVVDSTKNTDDTDSTTNDKQEQTKEVVGTGSGSLVIKSVKDKQLSIKPGTYSSIEIADVSNLTISGNNKVKITGGMVNMSNLSDVTLEGITIENANKGIAIKKSADNITLTDITLKNIGAYGIKLDINKKYDGSAQSFSSNIHLNNIHAENVRMVFLSTGGIKSDGFYGLIKNFRFTNSSIVNAPNLESAVYLNLGEDFEISNNIVNNVNAKSGKHNGIFHVKGNGKIFNNKVTNHQGNAVRSWLFSITKPEALVEIYNNIVYNSTRYGAFELQVTPSIRKLSTFKPANAKVYNNTVGKLNTGIPKYFEGRLLDLYNTDGTVEIFNNLSFNNRDEQLLNNMSGQNTRIIKKENNRYLWSVNDAVIDLKTFKSRIPGVGANL